MRRLVVIALVACSSREPTYVAKLEETVAQVDRMPRENAAWQKASVGDRFVLGSALRTGVASHARLVLGKNGRLDVEPNAVVRFTKRPGRKHGDVHVETGNVEIESGDEAFGLVGEVVLEPNTHARVARDASGALTINVTVGNVVLENNATVAAGNSITISSDGKPTVAKPGTGDAAMLVKVTGAPARSGDKSLPPGEHRVAIGAQLQVPADSTVEVQSDGARVVTGGPSALRTGGSPGALTTASTGALTLHADTADAIADVPGASIVARKGGSRAIVRLDATGTRVEAQQGETVIRTATGERKLAAGEAAVLAPDGSVDDTGKAPAHAKLAINAGESPVLHDPKAPTAVRVNYGCGAGVVEVAKDRGFKRIVARSRGTGGANVLVPAGSWSYRVRCDAGKAPGGTIRIARDSGRAPLPKAAARTTVEADGREYTILYENRLPALELAWRNAPAKARYEFVLEAKGGKPKRIPSAAPRVSLRSGELGEGSYRFWIENKDNGRRSEQTQIVIDFNNAAPSASLEGIEIKDGKVRVRGSVLEGSTVTINGAPVALDAKHRFSAEAAPQPGEEGVGIRIAHPKAGVHYYVVSTVP